MTTRPTRYTVREIASALGVSQQAVNKRARREAWPHVFAYGRGGKRHVFPLSGLPIDVQMEIIRSQKKDLSASDLGKLRSCEGLIRRTIREVEEVLGEIVR